MNQPHTRHCAAAPGGGYGHPPHRRVMGRLPPASAKAARSCSAGFANADAMYAPVVTRFNTYGVELHGEARAYADAMLALPPMQEWFAAGKAEPWSMPENDAA
jgi:glutathione S-transferase